MNKTKQRGRHYFHKAVLKFIFHLTPPCLFHDPLQRQNIESAFVVFHTFLHSFSTNYGFSRCNSESLVVHSENILVVNKFHHSLNHSTFKQLMVLSVKEEKLLQLKFTCHDWSRLQLRRADFLSVRKTQWSTLATLWLSDTRKQLLCKKAYREINRSVTKTTEAIQKQHNEQERLKRRTRFLINSNQTDSFQSY